MLLPQSVSRRVFDYACANGKVLASEASIDELADVLRRSKFDRYIDEEDRLHFLSTYVSTVEFVQITEAITDCRDPKDNKFLELAVYGDATYIISGDHDLRVLSPYRGIVVLPPGDFLRNS